MNNHVKMCKRTIGVANEGDIHQKMQWLTLQRGYNRLLLWPLLQRMHCEIHLYSREQYKREHWKYLLKVQGNWIQLASARLFITLNWKGLSRNSISRSHAGTLIDWLYTKLVFLLMLIMAMQKDHLHFFKWTAITRTHTKKNTTVNELGTAVVLLGNVSLLLLYLSTAALPKSYTTQHASHQKHTRITFPRHTLACAIYPLGNKTSNRADKHYDGHFISVWFLTEASIQ